MKATLYEALGIPQAASDEEVRASLRGLIRKYYAKTRDGQGNVEEALRFINHASRILSDSERRKRYDNELAVSAGTTEQRIAHVVSNAVAVEGEQTDVGAEAVDKLAEAMEDPLETGLDADDPAPESTMHHPGLTERVASFGRSPILTILLCVLFAVFIAAAIVSVTPADTVLVAKQVLVWLTLALIALTLVYGLVHGIAYLRRRSAPPAPSLTPQTDLAILNWRRERSVFLGTDHPQEDASWIFQLRMAELERAKSGRTSEPRAWHRLAARLFDYALWGLVLALLLSELRGAGLVPEDFAWWVGHPLIAPTLITLTWIPIEGLLIASLGTTPGKWLFGVYLQFSISDAYARRDARAHFERGLKRAFRVWWEGVACGFPLLAPILIAVAYEKLAQNQETDWDFAQDCLVTHGPPGIINAFTGVCGLAAMLWLYGVAWHQPMADSIVWARATITDALPSPEALSNFAGGGGLIGGLSAPKPPGEASQVARANLPSSLSSPGPATRGSVPLNGSVPITVPNGGANGNANGNGNGNGGTPITSPIPLPGDPVDPDLAAQFAERRAKVAVLKVEGPRMLRAGNWRRAAELCRAWADLDLANADAYRCLGQAWQAQGYHQDAIAAFRKAKQFDPADRDLDAAIQRSQNGIVADFLNRYRR